MGERRADTDEELVVRVGQGDPAAVRALVTRKLPRVLSLATRMLGDGAAYAVGRGCMPSLTNPNNLCIVTGVPPSRHGVPGNHYLDPRSDEEVQLTDPDFLRVCGADCNGTLLPIGPMLVYEQLPESNPVKKVAAGYITQYEAKYGKESRTTFGGHAYDTFALLEKAVPEALKRAKPGTKEFRAALRDALEASNVVGTHGVFVMTPQDHNGLDNRARVMIRIDNGKWVLVK